MSCVSRVTWVSYCLAAFIVRESDFRLKIHTLMHNGTSPSHPFLPAHGLPPPAPSPPSIPRPSPAFPAKFKEVLYFLDARPRWWRTAERVPLSLPWERGSVTLPAAKLSEDNVCSHSIVCGSLQCVLWCILMRLISTTNWYATLLQWCRREGSSSGGVAEVTCRSQQSCQTPVSLVLWRLTAQWALRKRKYQQCLPTLTNGGDRQCGRARVLQLDGCVVIIFYLLSVTLVPIWVSWMVLVNPEMAVFQSGLVSYSSRLW